MPSRRHSSHEEALLILDTIRTEIREILTEKSGAQPDRAVFRIGFGEIESIERLSDTPLFIAVVRQLEQYCDYLGDSPSVFATPAVMNALYVSQRIEALVLTERVITEPQVQLAYDVAELVKAELPPHAFGLHSFFTPDLIVERYQQLDSHHKLVFRERLHRHLDAINLSVDGQFDLGALQIQRNR